jgi:hypothetical protein
VSGTTADRLLDHYGHCVLPANLCLCLKPEARWLGRACPNWRTLGARTYAELRDAQAMFYRRGDAEKGAAPRLGAHLEEG